MGYYTKSLKLFDKYMRNNPPNSLNKEDEQFGITPIIEFMIFLTELIGLKITFEAKAGAGFGGDLHAGEGATVQIAIEAFAELNYRAHLFKDGQLFPHDSSTDLLNSVFEEIKKTLISAPSGKKMPIKSIFNL